MGIPLPSIYLKQQIAPLVINLNLNSVYRDAVNDALLEMAQFLQENSPRGISPPRESLKGSWDIIPARKVRNFFYFEGAIVNYALNARNRLEGRGPGKFPPFGPGTPLAAWADAKGIPPFLVARKIAREGTERWKEGIKGGRLALDPATPLGKKAQTVFQHALESSLARRLP